MTEEWRNSFHSSGQCPENKGAETTTVKKRPALQGRIPRQSQTNAIYESDFFDTPQGRVFLLMSTLSRHDGSTLAFGGKYAGTQGRAMSPDLSSAPWEAPGQTSGRRSESTLS